ncbi:MAG: Cna B-type domain-containing protein [Ruminococcus sp.]
MREACRQATATDTSVDGTVTTPTNTYAPEETSVSVRKVWDDSSNQDGIRPASVTVQLYADGKANGAPVRPECGE